MAKLRYILGTVIFMVLNFKAQGDDVMTIATDFWEYRLKNNPTFATYHGSDDYNDLMESYDINRFNVSRAKAEEFLGRLTALDTLSLNKSDKINYDILKDTLQTFLDGNLWAMYGSLNPISFINGIQLFGSPGIATSSTRGDFENYIARLHAVQKQVDEIKVLFRKAIELGRTLHNVSLVKVPDEIDSKLVDAPENSSYFEPFAERLNKSHIPEDVRNDIRSRGKTAVTAYIDAFRDLKGFIINEYMPHTREEFGVYAWDPTNQYYGACLKWHLSFEETPEQVHQLGLDEVERIRGKMLTIMANLGFQGSVSSFFDSLEGDTRFYSNDTDAILTAYNDTVFKKIYPRLPDYFKDIPYVPLKVEASTYDGLGGGYSSASENSPGTFSINLFRPDEIPSFEMMALSLHETVPGHHLQQSYSMKAHLPDFRKNSILSFYTVPNWFPFYSAYMEGWALYSEYLGEEMGLYENDYELMGRYSYEILRAVRLVVDTGLHYYKWSRDQAIEYMTNYTAMAPGSAANEIDRYITWPGQACAYKVGEIKIRQLRQNAKEKLGASFILKDFHKVLLENGGMPLSLLETVVNDWTEQVKRSSTHSSSSQDRCLSGAMYTLTFLLLLNIWM